MTTAIAYVKSRIGTVRIPTAEEERGLARRRDGGDDSARLELIGRNLPLALGLAGRSARIMPRYEAEFAGAAMLGLAVAAAGFDPDKGVRFATFATTLICHELQAVSEIESRLVAVPVDHQRPGRRSPSARVKAAGKRALRAGAAGRAGVADPLMAVATAPADEGERIDRDEAVAALRRAIAALPARTAEVVRLRALEGWTLQRVGDRLGITREWARRIEIDGMARLRASLAGEGTP